MFTLHLYASVICGSILITLKGVAAMSWHIDPLNRIKHTTVSRVSCEDQVALMEKQAEVEKQKPSEKLSSRKRCKHSKKFSKTCKTFSRHINVADTAG